MQTIFTAYVDTLYITCFVVVQFSAPLHRAAEGSESEKLFAFARSGRGLERVSEHVGCSIAEARWSSLIAAQGPWVCTRTHFRCSWPCLYEYKHLHLPAIRRKGAGHQSCTGSIRTHRPIASRRLLADHGRSEREG